jgi:serine/threonine protein kinase
MKELFCAAADQGSDATPPWLLAECGDDHDLLGRVERLLANHRQLIQSPHPSTPQARRILPGVRFEIDRFLGCGGFGDVWAAFDHKLGMDVAVKRLREPDGDALIRFKREFRLPRLRHRNLVRVHELIHEEASWLLVMELLDGCDFHESLALSSLAEVIGGLTDLFGQLIEGLAALHAVGIVHGDIKPSNVRVTLERRVVLLDFGLARRIGAQDHEQTYSALGTPDYISPEQACGQPVTEASDCYSAGVMLYQALTGRLPFGGRPAQAPEHNNCADGLFPSRIAPGIPLELDEICAGLLRRDPGARFDSVEVLGRLGKRSPAPAARPSIQFVGRASELDSLRRSFHDVSIGAGVCVVVTGESGIGKSELVNHFLDSVCADDPDVVLLRGRCCEAENIPYEAFDELLDELARFLGGLDPVALDAILPRSIHALCRAFPVLRPLLYFQRAKSEETPSDPLEERRNAFRALRELLARLADRRQVVLFIDDLQWADAHSQPIFEALFSGPQAPPLLLILAYREEDLERALIPAWIRSPACSFSIRMVEIAIPPLSPDETRDLAIRTLSFLPAVTIPEKALRQVVENAEGNPFLIREFAGYLRASPDPAPGITLRDVVERRVASIESSFRAALEVIAAAGEPTPETVIYEAAEIRDGCHGVREFLLQARLARLGGAESKLELDIYHARLRAVLLEGLLPARAREVHSRLAIAMERSGNANPERVYQHFREAGETEKAILWAGHAGDKAGSVLAFERAAELYQEALRLLPAHASPVDLHTRRARALAHAGCGCAAASEYFAAADVAESSELRLRILGTEQMLLSGQLTEGTARLREVLRQARVPYPQSRYAVIASILCLRLRIRLRGLRPATQPVCSEQRTAQMEACWSGALGTSMLDPIRSAEFSARHLIWALGSGDERRLCLALAAEATQSLPDGFRSASPESLMRAARDISERLADRTVAAFVANMNGILECMNGSWRQCLAESNRALELYQASGSGGGWERGTAVMFTLSSRILMGSWKEVATRLPPLVADAEKRGDVYSAVNFCLLTSAYAIHLAVDDPASAVIEARRRLKQWDQGRFDLQRYYAFAAELEAELYCGNGSRAWELVEQTWPAIRKSGLLRLPLTRVFGNYMRAKSAIAAAVAEPRVRSARRRLLAAAERFGRIVASERRPYAEALAVLIESCIAATRGDRNAALQKLTEAEEKLVTADLIPWAAVCRSRRFFLLGGEQSSWFDEQGIVDRSKIEDLLAPGDWGALRATSEIR